MEGVEVSRPVATGGREGKFGLRRFWADWPAFPGASADKGLDPDDSKTTELRKQILASKPFLRAIYTEWYSKLSAEVPAGTGAVLELGSGAGYCEQFIPEVVKSELIQ